MNKLLFVLFSMILSVGLFFDSSSAAAATSEVLTMNVNVTLADHTLIGTFVVNRSTSGQATWTFNGTYDGTYGVAQGTVAEQWNANTTGTITLMTLNTSAMPFDSLPTHTISISAGSGGVFTINGVPFAVKGPIVPPGAGNATVFVTNAGQGTRQILSLPNTAGDSPFTPDLIASLLCATGLGLIGIGINAKRLFHRTI